ncbi:hypothetical protein EIP91_007031 [Steccherinum ochraceum]|uniref:Uncharacterized protein n=1 Tax=Steccherinum ochraceum TaxID=92696 RepID=A0A4R0RYZ0_9APHY|nr:hypothetical protein EIP91_007031 [Steccherinum ochraceum]
MEYLYITAKSREEVTKHADAYRVCTSQWYQHSIQSIDAEDCFEDLKHRKKQNVARWYREEEEKINGAEILAGLFFDSRMHASSVEQVERLKQEKENADAQKAAEKDAEEAKKVAEKKAEDAKKVAEKEAEDAQKVAEKKAADAQKAIKKVALDTQRAAIAARKAERERKAAEKAAEEALTRKKPTRVQPSRKSTRGSEDQPKENEQPRLETAPVKIAGLKRKRSNSTDPALSNMEN